MKNLKRLFALVLCLSMVFALAACGNGNNDANTNDNQNGTEQNDSNTNNDANTNEPMTEEEELEAMKSEPAYEKGIAFWYGGGNCTASPYVAMKQGYFDKYGIKVEMYRGESIKEAFGTNAAQIGVSHIASMMVPITNNVNYTFVAGTIVGCQSLVVLGDSDINSTADLVGKKISCPNGIGNSSYNIGARFFDRDGIDPLNDVEFVQVESSACVAAMQSGEISAAVMSDTYTYQMVKDGTLKIIRSITYDDDFNNEPCCVLCMNNDFRNENPIMAKYVVKAVKEADIWCGEHAEEAVKMLTEDGFLSGDEAMNLELWNTLKWGVCTDEFTGKALDKLVDDYIRIGLITSIKDKDKAMEMIWNPLAPENE